MATSGVLIVAPDNRIRTDLRELFDTIGYSVTVASGPEEAIQLVNRHRHFLCLVDNELPDLSGLDLVREIRSLAPRILFGLMTQGQDRLSVDEGRKLGVAGWLFKPIDPRQVLEAVNTWTKEATITGKNSR